MLRGTRDASSLVRHVWISQAGEEEVRDMTRTDIRLALAQVIFAAVAAAFLNGILLGG